MQCKRLREAALCRIDFNKEKFIEKCCTESRSTIYIYTYLNTLVLEHRCFNIFRVESSVKKCGYFFRLKLTHFSQQLKQIINLVWFRMRKSQSDRGKKWNLISSFSHSGRVVFAAAARASLMWRIGKKLGTSNAW